MMDMTNIYFLIVVAIFCSFMIKVLNNMIRDANVVIRFLGYAVAIVVAVGVLGLVLNYYFNINIVTYLQWPPIGGFFIL